MKVSSEMRRHDKRACKITDPA